MNTLDALLSGIVADPLEETRWLVLADWVEENDDAPRAELLRLHRRLLATCCEPEAHPERAAWQARVVALLGAGVLPCVPRHTLELPGGVPLVGAFVPPGSFLMGSAHPDGYKDEKPVHRATVSTGFFMGVFPVTQAHWKAVMDSEPSRFTGSNKPVEQVSWAECQEFCTKLKAHLGEPYSVRLPTEVEWEWACRAGTTTEFHFGDTINTDLANNGGELWWLAGTVDGDPGQQTTDVRTFVANPWGLCDLHGNVQEWSADQFRGYSRDEQPNHRGGSGENTRIVRGGGWRSHPRSCRAAARCGYAPEIRCDGIGFRVAFRQA